MVFRVLRLSVYALIVIRVTLSKVLTPGLTAHSLQLIRVVLAVVVAVTLPAGRDAVPVETAELLRLTAFPCVFNAVFAVVGQVPLPLMRTLALWAQWTCGREFGM